RPRVAVIPQSQRDTELVAVAEAVGGTGFARVGSLDVSLLHPRGSAACEDIDCARLWNGSVLLIAIDALGVAPLELCRHGQRIAVRAEGYGMTELAAHLRIGGL